ncbi:MAG: hypothetical protein NVS9B15_24050 [Acidobacteriaceae bacterium]
MSAIARYTLGLFLLGACLTTAALGQAQTGACGNQPYCVDASDFVAVITNFRTSTVNNVKVIDATLRFQNKTTQPLTLGYVMNSGMAADDRGNRLIVGGPNGFRGIGWVNGASFDPKFTVPSHGYRDAQFELLQQGFPKIVGLNHTLDVSIAEISNLEAGQHSLAGEFPLHFQGLTNGASASVPALGSLSQVAASADPCAPGAANRATATLANAANAISNIGSMFGRKKTAQGAAQVANASSGCIPAAVAGATAATTANSVATNTAAQTATMQGQPSSVAGNTQQVASALPVADTAAPGASGQSAEPWTPPGDSAGAKSAPVSLDPARMPDIVGLRLGMDARAALAAVRARYPTNPLNVYDTNMSTFPNNVLQGVIVNPRGLYDERLDFSSTLPPDKPVVWRVERLTNAMHVARETLISALRAKYGKESALVGGDPSSPVTDLRDVAGILWLYDEAGRHVPIPHDNLPATLDCLKQFQSGVGNGFLLNEAHGEKIPTGWCATSFVAVYATFGQGAPIIEMVNTQMVDLPLAVRTAHATALWYRGQAERARKQDLEKAKAAKPVF